MKALSFTKMHVHMYYELHSQQGIIPISNINYLGYEKHEKNDGKNTHFLMFISKSF